MPSPKRVNKTKDEVVQEMVRKQVVAKEKELAHKMFAILESVDTIYDAQTACNALAGYIKYEVQVRNSQITLNDLRIDLSKEKKTKISEAMEALKTEFQNEQALDLASLFERFGKQLAMYGANEFLKKPMGDLKAEELIA